MTTLTTSEIKMIVIQIILVAILTAMMSLYAVSPVTSTQVPNSATAATTSTD